MGGMPALPPLPAELPALPELPELPELPAAPLEPDEPPAAAAPPEPVPPEPMVPPSGDGFESVSSDDPHAVTTSAAQHTAKRPDAARSVSMLFRYTSEFHQPANVPLAPWATAY
jgi:hypothetical protein